MMQFVEAFGGLVGVVLIGVAVLAAMIIVDWLMVRSSKKRAEKDDASPPR